MKKVTYLLKHTGRRSAGYQQLAVHTGKNVNYSHLSQSSMKMYHHSRQQKKQVPQPGYTGRLLSTHFNRVTGKRMNARDRNAYESN